MDSGAVYVKNQSSYNKIKTTITVKMGTKNRLEEMASKGESFDDVINRLINSNDTMIKQIADYKKQFPEARTNRIEVLEMERGIGSVGLSDGTRISFSYNKPISRTDEDYSMDIDIEKVYSDEEAFDIDDDIFAMIYFYCVQNVINIHFDQAFSISGNKNPLNPAYWKTIWDRIGLYGHSFDRDILRYIAKFVEGEDTDHNDPSSDVST